MTEAHQSDDQQAAIRRVADTVAPSVVRIGRHGDRTWC